MKKILAINGSPRRNGNTSILVRKFMEGVVQAGGEAEEIVVQDLNLKFCTGCLRCNILGRCSLRDDDWDVTAEKILQADVLVFASPVYFHHVSAQMKKLIDRFRSFVKVQITETGLQHTPWKEWNKDFVLVLCMGSSDIMDAQPVIDLFCYMTKILGSGNKLHVITSTRLAVVNQVTKTGEELAILYEKLGLPGHLAPDDAERNRKTLEDCFQLGMTLSTGSGDSS